MTSAPIMEMAQTGFMPSQNVTKAGNAPETVQFSKTMDFAFAGGQSDATMQSEVRAEVQEGSDSAKTHAQKSAAENVGRKEIRRADQPDETEFVSEEEAAEKLTEKEGEILEEIAVELGVSPEDVMEAMETLGLTLMDLFSQGNMALLAGELKGLQSVELLTDEALFGQITELTQNVQEELVQLADSLGMTVEELEQTIKEQLTTLEMEVPQEVKTGQEPLVDTLMPEDGIQVKDTADAREVLFDNLQDVNAEKELMPRNMTEETEPEESTHPLMAGKEIQGGTEKKGFDEKESQQQDNSYSGSLLEQTLTKNFTVTENQVVDKLFDGEFDLQRTREIIDQIADYVKLNHSEKVSSMEIQLHPASLGTVNLQVVAKDGVISAQLAAQDDAVRAALESQVTQLKESLEAQGLKIDAVEVTVASHAFEQNLQQQDQDTRQQAEREKKGVRRILNLDEIDQDAMLEEEMSDAERLQIEMMRMGGNKLNFRV